MYPSTSYAAHDRIKDVPRPMQRLLMVVAEEVMEAKGGPSDGPSEGHLPGSLKNGDGSSWHGRSSSRDVPGWPCASRVRPDAVLLSSRSRFVRRRLLRQGNGSQVQSIFSFSCSPSRVVSLKNGAVTKLANHTHTQTLCLASGRPISLKSLARVSTRSEHCAVLLTGSCVGTLLLVCGLPSCPAA